MPDYYADTAGLMQAIERELELREWTVTDMAHAVAQRFSIKPDSVGRIWRRAELSGNMTEWWADRFITALELWSIYEIDTRLKPGLDAWCPRCRAMEATTSDGCCVWCETQTGGNTVYDRPPQRANAGVPYLADDEVLLEARRLYLTGMSFRRVAAELHSRTAYASAKAFANQLHASFTYRGWKARDRVDATVAASWKHGLHGDPAHRARLRRRSGEIRGVMCKGVRQQYPKKGEPCSRPALAGGEWCIAHDPKLKELRDAQLRQARRAAGREESAA